MVTVKYKELGDSRSRESYIFAPKLSISELFNVRFTCRLLQLRQLFFWLKKGPQDSVHLGYYRSSIRIY